MKARHMQLVLSVCLVLLLSSCIVFDLDKPADESPSFKNPMPEFPESESLLTREGWVVVSYKVANVGIVGDVRVKHSSGNGRFDGAALDAIKYWRFPPGNEHDRAVLVSFIGGRERIRLSGHFSMMYTEAHNLIDNGELRGALDVVYDMRDLSGLHPSELAYSYLTQARIAAERGDRTEQLEHVRKAMLNDGMWLTPEHYLEALHVAVVVAFYEDDLASAIRDYELLTQTPEGKERAADLKDLIKGARIRFEADPLVAQPFLVADERVLVRSAHSKWGWPKQNLRNQNSASHRPATAPQQPRSSAQTSKPSASRGSRGNSKSD